MGDLNPAFKYSEILNLLRTSMQSTEIDIYDCECIVSNLIEQGYIKGHIQLSHQTLVLSKSKPFPSIKSINPPIGLPY
ncbi:PCI domain-containing protein 2 [Smittium culicis]|uniref:PCI domain-containing protein 2 n=1 Tax=Smittium culicis TaxID=133412 RepID=A0A1R1YDL2_9FUNG|nr:PCI domain-containing protein 2 [Smittium culicis]